MTTLHPSLEGARACVFDAGGTLIHPDWGRLARLAAGVTGREFGAEELRLALSEYLKAPTGQKGRHWTFRGMYCSLGVDEEACGRVIELLDEEHVRRHIWCGPDPEAARVIEELKGAGLAVAVISNTEDGRALDALEAAGLARHFDLVVDSHLVGCRKPDPTIFRLALERLGVEPHEAAFVGDSYEADALAARAAGLRPVLLDPLGLHTACDCPRIRSLAELVGGAV
ncbi:MAG TPA: HAD family hydrolase [Pyrinomonadaceae bacterium]|nr:HAD family hydrolase [Pyrinomonadaceae bacterium]